MQSTWRLAFGSAAALLALVGATTVPTSAAAVQNPLSGVELCGPDNTFVVRWVVLNTVGAPLNLESVTTSGVPMVPNGTISPDPVPVGGSSDFLTEGTPRDAVGDGTLTLDFTWTIDGNHFSGASVGTVTFGGSTCPPDAPTTTTPTTEPPAAVSPAAAAKPVAAGPALTG